MGFAERQMEIRRSSDSAAASWWSRRKHVDAKGRKSHQLAKRLSALQLVPIGVGSTIGAGVYVLVGTVAREKSGPALTLSFLIAGIAAAFSAFCYAELASRCPSAGSAYHYSYICVGEGVAWLIGWGLILEYSVGGSAVARGVSPNLALLLGGEANLPSWLSRSTISGTSIEVDPCAAILVILVTALLCAGVKESATVQAIITFTNVCVLILVIVAGAIIGFKTDWIGYRQADGFLPFGINGMLGGAATVFFAYIGFDSVASTAEEVKHPQRDLPLGIGIALSLCGTLYMLVSAVIVGIVPYDEMDVDTPMSAAFSRYGVGWAVYVVSAGAVAALLSTLMGSLLPQPRILMAMARDGLLPYFFLNVNKCTLVPVNSTITTGVAAMLLAFFMNVDELSGMVSVGTLLAFATVSVSILILRFVPPMDIIISSSSSTSQCSSSSTSQCSLPNTDFGDLLAVQGSKEDGTRPLLVEDKEHQVDACESTTQVDKQQDFPSKSDNKRRLWAAMGICASCIGAIFIAIGASGSLLPSWSRWILGCAGGVVYLTGAIIMGCLKQDEGQHTFGHSGGFICPFVPWLPLLSILINVYLLANLGLTTWLRVGAWLIVGVGVYFSYGIRHSLLAQQDGAAQASEKSEIFASLA